LLSDVRDVVKEMRQQEQFDLVATLQGLVKQLPDCHLDIGNTSNIQSLSLKQQLIFCLQEGISNALRHGKANQFTLESEKKNSHLVVTLINNGTTESSVTFGSGLTGMQERLADFNGQVELLSNAQGCMLKIEVEDCYD